MSTCLDTLKDMKSHQSAFQSRLCYLTATFNVIFFHCHLFIVLYQLTCCCQCLVRKSQSWVRALLERQWRSSWSFLWRWSCIHQWSAEEVGSFQEGEGTPLIQCSNTVTQSSLIWGLTTHPGEKFSFNKHKISNLPWQTFRWNTCSLSIYINPTSKHFAFYELSICDILEGILPLKVGWIKQTNSNSMVCYCHLWWRIKKMKQNRCMTHNGIGKGTEDA